MLQSARWSRITTAAPLIIPARSALFTSIINTKILLLYYACHLINIQVPILVANLLRVNLIGWALYLMLFLFLLVRLFMLG